MPDLYPNSPATNSVQIRKELDNAMARMADLTDVLGTQSVTDGRGKLRTKIAAYEQSPVTFGTIGSLNGPYVSIDVTDYESMILEVTGTWVGTLNFEGCGNSGVWTLLSGSELSTGSSTQATTNGTYRFSVQGLSRVRAGFSAYSSGIATVIMRASTSPITSAYTSITGAVTVVGSGTFTTSDTTWASLWGASGASPTALNYAALVRPAVEPAPLPLYSPTQNTTYISKLVAQQPQIYSRLRVEAGGSEKLPFAQEQGTNQMVVTDDSAYPILESILLQLRALNEIMIQFTNVSPPTWWDTVNDGFKFQ